MRPCMRLQQVTLAMIECTSGLHNYSHWFANISKIESRRRLSRGRRSSIKVVVDGSSPATIVAPLSDSILNNKAVDQETQLIQRRNNVLSYRAHLEFEKEEWDERYERQKLLLQLSSRLLCALDITLTNLYRNPRRKSWLEPRSELLAQKNWWEDLKNKLLRR
ncbi:hypothetical protein KIN20_029366 [Parelaphostrongylus tenuis]|uniref:Uncharacterized protein n=1 Tax=Parelaphostrongylus tenuis TaxID=148309 RepID=A0AAD5WFI1_PARTN|nr:hypothetical protein KIN20_029366 [Parelaphostrongylus tenuis]